MGLPSSSISAANSFSSLRSFTFTMSATDGDITSLKSISSEKGSGVFTRLGVRLLSFRIALSSPVSPARSSVTYGPQTLLNLNYTPFMTLRTVREVEMGTTLFDRLLGHICHREVVSSPTSSDVARAPLHSVRLEVWCIRTSCHRAQW